MRFNKDKLTLKTKNALGSYEPRAFVTSTGRDAIGRQLAQVWPSCVGGRAQRGYRGMARLSRDEGRERGPVCDKNATAAVTCQPAAQGKATRTRPPPLASATRRVVSASRRSGAAVGKAISQSLCQTNPFWRLLAPLERRAGERRQTRPPVGAAPRGRSRPEAGRTCTREPSASGSTFKAEPQRRPSTITGSSGGIRTRAGRSPDWSSRSGAMSC